MLKQIIHAGFVALCFGAMPTIAGADTFMLIQGIAGDATDPQHKGWIRVSSLDWGVSNATTIGSATGGAGAGKATGDKLKLTIPTGPWSREIMNTLTRGQHYPQVVIDHVNTDGRPSYRVTIGTLFLTHYRNALTPKAQPQDEIEGVFGSFRAEFYAVGADGRVSSSPVGWNFITNTAN